MEKHTPWEGQKLHQHDDGANLVSQFINEGISVTLTKKVGDGSQVFPQDDQHSSQMSLPFDFKIQCNQYHVPSKKSKTIPTEVSMRKERKMQIIHH